MRSRLHAVAARSLGVLVGGDSRRVVGDARHEREAAWRFVRSGAMLLGAIENAELAQIYGLMSRYVNRPMGFADATLVYLARREPLSTTLTTEHADFSTYGIEGMRKFDLLPAHRL